jgi:erythronate-4-phosphate dehydrogenase
LRAVVLDVWENEPDIDNELLDMVTLASPHIAGYSFDGKVAGLIMIYQALCNHFQIPATKKVVDFLPAPQIPQLEINSTADEQEAIRLGISRLYDIWKDDADTRQILEKLATEKGPYFDSLRKGYRRRREFQNTRVLLEPPNESLEQQLEGIGFHV